MCENHIILHIQDKNNERVYKGKYEIFSKPLIIAKPSNIKIKSTIKKAMKVFLYLKMKFVFLYNKQYIINVYGNDTINQPTI